MSSQHLFLMTWENQLPYTLLLTFTPMLTNLFGQQPLKIQFCLVWLPFLSFPLVYKWDVRTDRNGARLPAWINLHFPGDFVPSGQTKVHSESKVYRESISKRLVSLLAITLWNQYLPHNAKSKQKNLYITSLSRIFGALYTSSTTVYQVSLCYTGCSVTHILLNSFPLRIHDHSSCDHHMFFKTPKADRQN